MQKIADVIFSMIEPELKNYFSDFSPNELERVEVEFINKSKLNYPKWLLKRRGKTLLNEVYNKIFRSQINFSSLFKALKKINMFPVEIVSKLNEIRKGVEK